MKNKRKISIVIGIIILIIILCSAIIINIRGTKTLNEDETEEALKNIKNNKIVEVSYQNFAWLKEYRGSIICNDGNIYKFDIEGEEFSKDSAYGKIKLARRKMLKKDLELIKKYISSVDSNYIQRHTGCDMGESGIYVWKDNVRIILKEKGDIEAENNSNNVRKLIFLIKKYVN